MVCKKCGAECLDNAKFCGSCGARIDGKIACKSCGELNDEGTLFCVQCGARMDGKKACLYCGTVYAGNFCTECGRGAEPTVEEEVVTTSVRYITPTKAQSVETTARKWSIAKILDISAGALSMIAVLCALIFVFFIGVAPDVAGTLSKKQTNTIFYYFGDYQKSIASIMKLGSSDLEELGYSLWFLKQIQASTSAIGTFGLIVGILALVTVLTTATGAITVFVHNCLGYSEKKADKWAIACVISFFVFAFAFLSLHTVVVEGVLEALTSYSSSSNSESTVDLFGEIGLTSLLGNGNVLVFSGATKAGIVLCAVFLGLFVAFRVVALGKKLLSKKTLILSLLACVGIAFASVVMSLAKTAGTSMVIFGDKVELGFTLSPILANTMWTSAFASAGQYYSGYATFTKALASITVLNTLSQIVLLVALIFAGLTVGANLNGVSQKDNGCAVFLAVMTLISSVLFLVFSIISYVQIETALEILAGGESVSEYMSPNYTKQICVVVFSALSLVTSIVFNVLKEKDKKPDNKWNLRSYY